MKKATNFNRVFWLLAGICLVFSSTVSAQFSRTIVADNVLNGGPTWYGHERNVTRTTDNTVVVTWQNLSGTGGQVVGAPFDEAFGVWSLPLQISFAGDEADKIGTIADNSGRIHAAWQQREPGGTWQIYHAINTSGSWSTPVRVSQVDSLDSEECAIEIDSNGRIVVAWNTDAEPDGLEWVLASFSSDDGATWSVPDTLSSSDGIIDGGSTTSGRAALWAGSNGRLVAAWHENYPGREREIRVNQYDGTNWAGEVVVSDTSDTTVSRHWHPNICMDSQDNIYVLFASDNGTGRTERRMLMNSKAWDAEWTLAVDTIAVENSADFLTNALTIDQNDVLYAGYRRDIAADTVTNNDEVAYQTSTDLGKTWSEPVVLSRPNHDAGYLSFVGHVSGSGVDAVWRESASEFVDNQDTTTVLHALIELTPVGIEDDGLNTPQSFALSQNYPNPFNPTTQIEYSIFATGNYTLSIYNLLGEKIRTLISQKLISGEYTAEWDGKNNVGKPASSGVYFYRLSGENQTLTKKMILLR